LKSNRDFKAPLGEARQAICFLGKVKKKKKLKKRYKEKPKALSTTTTEKRDARLL